MAVIVVRHREKPDLMNGCLEGIARQEDIVLEVHVLDQNPDKEICDITEAINGKGGHRYYYHRVGTFSLAKSRNLGIEYSDSRYISFIDPDSRVSSGWAKCLYEALGRPGVAIAGGRIIPLWMGRERWLHRSNFVKEMAGYLDLSEVTIKADRVLGGNFSIDREQLGPQCYFCDNLGRNNKRLYGGEETELCERASAHGWEILFVPEAQVDHLIPPERMSVRSTLSRSFYAGMSRGNQGGRPKPLHRNRKLVDWLALILILPFYMCGYLYGRLRPLHARESV